MADSELSYEMIMEIISRASLKTLDMIRCTNKELNTLTYESYLLDLYMKRNKIVSGFIIPITQGFYYINEFAPSVGSTSLDLSFLPFNSQILATSDQGLIVFRRYDPYCGNYFYHVCKPTTKQVLALPNPEVKKHMMNPKFAFVVLGLNPLHYKIFRFSDNDRTVRRWGKLYNTYSCDVFDSATWEWRSLNHVMFKYGVNLKRHDPPITKSGLVHMLLTNNDVFKFDVHSEKWKVIVSPVSYEDGGRPLPRLACKQSHGDACWEIAPSLGSTSLHLSFLPYEEAQVLATSDQGLIVFQNHPYCRNHFYFVYKTTTEQVWALPNPEVIKQENQKFAIVVMSLNLLHYKIIRFSDNLVSAQWRGKYTTYRCDVFDSVTWEWRSLKHIKFKFCVSSLSRDNLITKSGSIYMLLSNNDVFKFDAHSEKWKIIPSPVSYDLISTATSMPSVKLVKYGGKLALACKQPYGDDCWEIWVLNRAGQLVWEKVHVFKQKEDERGSLKAIYDSDTSVMTDGCSLVYYRYKQEGNTMIKRVLLENTPSQIFSFRSDFEMIDLSPDKGI